MQSDPSSSNRGQTVLVVDDDPDARMICQLILARDGYRVVTSGDGESALHLVAEHAPAAIILDIALPGRDGWYILEKLREDAALAGVPVIVYTAHALETDRARSERMGCAAYLVKPCTASTIVEAVRRVAGPAAASPGRGDEIPLVPAHYS